MSKRFHLRLLTHNIWHGLDHTRPLVMLPVENYWQRRRRLKTYEEQVLALRKEATDQAAASNTAKLDVFCFQEVNPVRRRTLALSKLLHMTPAQFEINVGLKLGELSYPFFLQEGLATLWSPSVEKAESEKLLLSGVTLGEGDLPWLHTPYTFHFGERRGALIVRILWEGRKFVFVNLHLHHGPPASGESKRRVQEVESLVLGLEEDLKSADSIFLLGDFNAELDHAELQILASLGFVDLSLKMTTWDPDHNELCKRNSNLNFESASKAWDERTHQFDHVFFRSTSDWMNSAKVQKRRIFDQAYGQNIWLSDHYGLMIDIQGDF